MKIPINLYFHSRINVYEKRPRQKTNFYIYFKRGDIPVCSAITQGKTLEQKQQVQKQFPIKWLCDPDKIDYCYYLPIFIDGLADKNEDIRTLAQHAAMDLIIRGPNKVSGRIYHVKVIACFVTDLRCAAKSHSSFQKGFQYEQQENNCNCLQGFTAHGFIG